MGAKFYEALNKVTQLCVNMDISIKEMRSKPVRLGKDIMFILFNNVKLPSTETHFFSGEGAYFKEALITNFKPYSTILNVF